MKHFAEHLRSLVVLTVIAAGGAVACTGTVRAQDPGAPAAAQQPGYTAADVGFMQGMMAHHAQAVEMTALVPARTDGRDVQVLAERIAVSQEDELSLMRRWLEDRDQAVPGPHAHHSGEHAGMPGMLTSAEMARLRAAREDEFDLLFLTFMIHHHEGALVMVEELFATDGAGQQPEIFQFASHVESDQRIEITRMRQLLHALQADR